ncbi:MAG: hypothetical protein JTT11_05130 [Candidatus Brockarchaeota archaeon]|nr:hypothetical protein [Candidatus Brockarchaeota archaeon]
MNPLKGFKEDVVTFEYRKDPLTGRNTTVVKGMLEYVSKFLSTDEKLLGSLAEKTRVGCPFCPESVMAKTPMFTEDFSKEGRIRVGNAVVVPNLLGHAERSAVVVMAKEHSLRLDEFEPSAILDGLKGGLAYVRRLSETDPSVSFPVFAFNYLPPAGSSIFHPHMQVLARDRPFYLARLFLEKSEEYREVNGSNYWHDLVEVEKPGERHLFEKDGVEWLVPFAPLRGLNEVQAVVVGRSNFLELGDGEWLGIAEGISSILRFYHEQGYVSFNAVLLSGPVGAHLDYFCVNLRMVSRPGIQPTCFTDAWALPYLLWDGEALEEPEVLAGKIRAFLGRRPGGKVR